MQSIQQAHTVSWAESCSGPPNALTWTVECKVSGEVKGTGSDARKANAKDAAAKEALEALGVQ